ncbi:MULTISPECIES: allantoate amidohydrolase [Thermocrispum]|jgi:N-carbamoyl-L-amino-acid hydrolase|uniref:Allantoate amidohydrolase n=1 Tax=Thermocrispum agreste TaxID=37925 RepID=A0A2W4M153_9PSEU|nr:MULTISPECIES: allantoate amidohydrolase [Thermocrispum]PZN01597.1 MAG: allantoate amidohydrolase [Thermocrispum agreste]
MTLLRDLEGVGADRFRGGYSRHVFTAPELELRAWFTEQAQRRGLDVEQDRNGNLWAWWGRPGPDAVVTGSHLDSVPGGGAFDGPLGVASALAAVDRLRAQGFRPRRPLAVVVFAEEEGGRFGVACLGSRLLTGAIAPERALTLTDADGVTFAEAARRAGIDPARVGPDPDRLGMIGAFVELHVEQGRALEPLGQPVAIGSTIDPHGRWRLSFVGRGDHAGTALMGDRRDPMVPAARTVLAARSAARAGTRATVGRLVPVPGGTNVIARRVDLWLDTRSASEPSTREAVDEVISAARLAAAEEGCEVEVREESFSGEVTFDAELRERIQRVLGEVPVLPTGAGHDAGVLAAHVPAGMLYVRNPTGVSHAPEEFATDEDCAAGVESLAAVLEELAG